MPLHPVSMDSKSPDSELRLLEFFSFCVEMFAQREQRSGVGVADFFGESGVFRFLRDGYEPIHTLGKDGILGEIDDYLALHSGKAARA